MKKSKFNCINMNKELFEVSGYVSEHFGIHKVSIRGGTLWDVTHLKTGGAIVPFELKKKAREFVGRLENETPTIPWQDMTLENCYMNTEIIRQNRDIVLGY